MKIFIFGLIAFVSISVNAGGQSNLVVPSGIDIVQAGTKGFMIYGTFGNAGGCTNSNSIFVKADNPKYDKIYATALAAYMAGKKLRAYIHSCEPVGWYAGSEVTYNILGSGGSLYIRN